MKNIFPLWVTVGGVYQLQVPHSQKEYFLTSFVLSYEFLITQTYHAKHFLQKHIFIPFILFYKFYLLICHETLLYNRVGPKLKI